MIAVDTNVVIRLLTQDDPAQFAAAKRLFSSYEEIFLATTVILESEWVLRAAYGFSRPAALAALKKLCGLANVTLENGPLLAQAFSLTEQGLEFADALHLAAAAKVGRCERMATFDQKLLRAAAAHDDLTIFCP